VKINDDHSQDGPQLDHIEEHLFEGLRKVQLDEFFDEDHVARAADGQPFSDTLNDAEDDCFQYFHKCHRLSFPIHDFLMLHHLV